MKYLILIIAQNVACDVSISRWTQVGFVYICKSLEKDLNTV